jgi:hypothetical protein
MLNIDSAGYMAIPKEIGIVHLVVLVVSSEFRGLHRKVDIRLHGKGNSSSHGARPVHYGI